MHYREPASTPPLFVTFATTKSLFALDAETGKVLWKNDDLTGASGGTLVAHGDRLFIAGGGRAVCIDARSGSTIWRCDIKIYSRPALIIAGDRVYIGGEGTVECLSIDGRQIWRNGFEGEGSGRVAMSIGAVSARDDRDR